MSGLLTPLPEYTAQNEAEVEQRFIYPLMVHSSFLGLSSDQLRIKAQIAKLDLSAKSKTERGYIPDYIYFEDGLPTLIIEAKAPNVAATVGYDEARLYAAEINSLFPPGINPVGYVLSTNGRDVLVGSWDSTPTLHLRCADVVIGSEALKQVLGLIGRAALVDYVKSIRQKTKVAGSSSAAELIAPTALRRRMEVNALAPFLQPLNEMFFRADEPERIRTILEKAYVDTQELRTYDRVLSVYFKQIERAYSGFSTNIETDRTREYHITPVLERFGLEMPEGGRLHLIIGSAGSGKSLFIQRLFLYLMPDELKSRALWAIIDFNRMPSQFSDLETDLCEAFVLALEKHGLDLSGFEAMCRIFGPEVEKLKRGPLSVFPEDEQRKEIAKELMRFSTDHRKFAQAVSRHFGGEQRRPIVVAFDNVDRRESSQQLEIFQAVQWFRNFTRSFALLTLRDTTFELYKNQPPLDTYLHTNNFNLRPPRFSTVLQKRLQLALEALPTLGGQVDTLSQAGVRIRYSPGQLSNFLQTVYRSLFDSHGQVGTILDALAGRNVREALGMFTRIISSGHFDETLVPVIGAGTMQSVPPNLLLKILMRSDYALFQRDGEFIHNIFPVRALKRAQSHFVLIETLGFLLRTTNRNTDDVQSTYLFAEDLRSQLISMGYDITEVDESLITLVKAGLLVREVGSQQGEDRTSFALTPSGILHLRSLPQFVEYIASVALWARCTSVVLQRDIAQYWQRPEGRRDLSRQDKIAVARRFVDYLFEQKRNADLENPLFAAQSAETGFVLDLLRNAIDRETRSLQKNQGRSHAQSNGRAARPQADRRPRR